MKEDEEGDTDEGEGQPEAAPGTERPTTKAGILAWRQSIIEGLELAGNEGHHDDSQERTVD